ncbi:DeoR-like protein with HTH domain [Scopulibacillus darangshiensis]|uniref:DeoR-like protein with HTH domain n=1 Tax=Scopulibacillus darangshiensis TaxID=442528 RepID=A0A4R2NEQ9_9BACL|nr:DeoR family transcriptional regulator [Scopulibacillus darangshiensis]TCP19753.1 DeoR-like protein with HTH domain [Scopulibacillus darangshiensis]
MLPIERRKKIKEWITEQQHMKISDLSGRLKVSEMTIHRDIQALVEEGFIVKTFGGVSLSPNAVKKDETDSNRCVVCQRPINDRLSYRLIKSGGEIETACCAHCGLLRHHQLGDTVIQGLCYDFLMHTTISVFSAMYVIEPELPVNCCHPQILAFGNVEYAKKFVKGFGGECHDFQTVIEVVSQHMCAKKGPDPGL